MLYMTSFSWVQSRRTCDTMNQQFSSPSQTHQGGLFSYGLAQMIVADIAFTFGRHIMTYSKGRPLWEKRPYHWLFFHERRAAAISARAQDIPTGLWWPTNEATRRMY